MGHRRKGYFKEFWRRFISSRLVVFIIMEWIILDHYISGIRTFSAYVNYPSSPWLLPFLTSDLYFMFLYGVAIIYFYSEVPFTERSEMYVVARCGRKKWVKNKLFYIWQSAIFLVLLLFFICIGLLLPNIELSGDWGKLIYTLASTDTGGIEVVLRCYYYIVANYSMAKAMCLTCVELFLITGMTGTLMFAISIFNCRMLVIFLPMVLATLSIVAYNRVGYFVSFFAPFLWSDFLVLSSLVMILLMKNIRNYY